MRALLSVLLLGGATLAQAETLEQAWQQALDVSRSIKAAAFDADAAQSGLEAAQSAQGPSLSLEADWRRFDHAYQAELDVTPLTGPLASALGTSLPGTMTAPLTDTKQLSGEARVSLPVYTSGRLEHKIDAARATIDVAAQDLRRTRLDVKYDVAVAYLDVLRARRAQDVARTYLSSLTSYRRDVDQFYARGLVARVDALGAQVAQADASQRLIAASDSERIAAAAYNRLLGRPLAAPVTLSDLSYPRERRDIATLTQTALARRPEPAQLSARSDALRAEAKSVRAQAGPQVGIYAAYDYLDNPYLVNKGTGSIGIGVRWAVFDSGLSRSSAGSVESRALAVDERREETLDLIRLEVERAARLEHDAATRMDVAAAALAAADEYLKIQRDRYANGLANQTEVLAGEARRSEARRNDFNARYDHALAILRIRRATGEM
ncbi:TolC family protein [Paludibacterium yongneupense]|uniref:TolC family protein n=1 Tax=Paludibacterium yongneupense TaxID=400061 RepID=UPI0003FC1490|nr:TolC family protein [Paludibacterium yongneupense]